MKWVIVVGCVLASSLPILALAEPGPASRPATKAAPATRDSASLEKLLRGRWKGPACGGDYQFRADGTFALDHFSPGNNTLTGTWSVRWDALPPTLVLSIKTSDLKAKTAAGEEFAYLGKDLELQLVELRADVLALRSAADEWLFRYSRPPTPPRR